MIIKTLSKLNYSKELVKNLLELNLIHDLCEKIWSAPQWLKFSTYCLNFMQEIC